VSPSKGRAKFTTWLVEREFHRAEKLRRRRKIAGPYQGAPSPVAAIAHGARACYFSAILSLGTVQGYDSKARALLFLLLFCRAPARRRGFGVPSPAPWNKRRQTSKAATGWTVVS